jgi:hypothetical protein
VGVAYAGSFLGSIHLRGWDAWSAYTFKILYAEPEVTVGEILRRGEVLGVAQDVSAYHAARGAVGMKNHIHVETHTAGGAVDPLSLMEEA